MYTYFKKLNLTSQFSVFPFKYKYILCLYIFITFKLAGRKKIFLRFITAFVYFEVLVDSGELFVYLFRRTSIINKTIDIYEHFGRI